MKSTYIRFVDADENLRIWIIDEWSDMAARHMHISNGFSIVAFNNEMPIGLISVYWKQLPAPLSETFERFIDVLEVRKDYRRKGLATNLIEISKERTQAKGVYQLRAWTSEDKVEAIPMWKALGFDLCPATTYPKDKEVEGYCVAKVL